MNNHPEWNESYYFNLHDHSNGVTAFMRIGNKPNKDEKSMFLFLIEKDRVCGMRNAVPCDGEHKACSGLKFELENGVWHISYQGPLFDTASKEPSPIMSSMDLMWKPVNPEMDYHDCVDEKGAALSAQTASEHFEQFGIVTGKIVCGDRTYGIDGTGERDKSEGVRDWGAPKMWLWLNSVYGKDAGFNATKLCTQMGDVDAGYFGTENSNDPVVKIDIDISYGKGIPAGYDMVMHGKSGKEYAVKAKVIGHATLPMQGSKDMMLVETISETVMDGRTGYGIAEFLVPAPKQ
ncbi:hypothetical protein TALC_00756 [Thermoplasmatales archaeon BRNA1]|nr:hypothetical protein TALC_00756 [Thermoplasmatales archaeon BRNA1]